MNNGEVLTWLDYETTRNNQYHNHKETMAWVATALYVSGVITAGFNLYGLHSLAAKIIVTFLFIIIALGTFLFVCWQLKNRDIAKHKVKYLTLTKLELLSTSYPKNWGNNNDSDWVLPCYIVEKIKKLENHPKLPPDTTWSKLVSFGALGISSLIFLLSVWSFGLFVR